MPSNLAHVCEVCGCGYQAHRPAQRFCSQACHGKAQRGPTVCAIEGCNAAVIARGWCKTHYARWRTRGDPLAPPRPTRGAGRCDIPGCSEVADLKRLCSHHYYRLLRYGDPLAPTPDRRRNPPRCCEVDGCGQPHAARGLCSTHYGQWRKSMKPKIDGPGSGWWRGCSVCRHPNGKTVDLMLMMGEPIERAAELVGKSVQSIYWHMEHTGLPIPPRRKGRRCSVCEHPDVDDIDADIERYYRELQKPVVYRGRRAPTKRRKVVGEWSIPSLELKWGLNLKAHASVEHQQRRAAYALARLNALKETA